MFLQDVLQEGDVPAAPGCLPAMFSPWLSPATFICITFIEDGKGQDGEGQDEDGEDKGSESEDTTLQYA